MTVTGWMDSTQPYYNYVPKMQGFTVRDGSIYVAHGGYWGNGDTKYLVSDIGVSKLSTDGTLLSYGVVDNQKFAQKLTDSGYTVYRTENEGVTVHPATRALHSLLIIGDRYHSSSKMLIIEEFSDFGTDYSDIPSLYTPFNLKDYENFFWRNSPTGIFNPITRTQITTFAQLLDFMVQADLPSTM